MPDLEIHLEGGDAEQAAAELGAVFEYDYDAAGHGGIAPGPVLTEHERRPGAAAGSEIITMRLGLPSDVLANEDLSQKVHLLETFRRMIEIAARHRERHGTSARVEAGPYTYDLADMGPDLVLDAARRMAAS